MKKILTILLALAISTSAFGINVKIINDTNTPGGWKTKIESGGQFITGYRTMSSRGNIANFYDIPSVCTIQIVSQRSIGKGTAISSSKTTLRKDIDSNQNVTMLIKECDVSTRACQDIKTKKESSNETASEGNSGKNNKYYYIEIE